MSASGAGAVSVNFPALPEAETRVSTTTPTFGEDTKTETLSPEQLAAREGMRDVTERQIAATGEQRKLKEREAQIGQQDVELQQFAQEAEQSLRTGPEAQAAKDYVDWARRHTRESEAKYEAQEAPRLFAGRDTWGQVRLAVGMGLAGLGDAVSAAAAIRAGHAPGGQNTVASIIDRDLDRQRGNIEKLKDNVAMARTGLKDAEEARRALLADVDLRAKFLYKKAEMLTRARLAALKLDQAAIDQTKEVLDLKAKQAEHEAEYVKGHSTSVTKRWDSAKTTNETINRQPSAGEAGKIPGQQSALAKQALVELAKLESGDLPSSDALKKVQDNSLVSSAADTSIEGGKVLAGGGAMVGRAFNAVPRNKYEGLKEKDLVTFQTMDRAQQLLMHVMTGAGASMEEARKKAEAFGWVPNDTPASMKAKIQGAKELANQFVGAAAATGGAQPAATPAARAPEFSRDRVAKANEIARDKNQPREKRDRARAYIQAAAKAGVR